MNLEVADRRSGVAFRWILLVVAVVPLSATVHKRLDIVDESIAFHGGETYQRSSTRMTMCSKSGCYDLGSKIDGGLFELEVEGPVAGHRRRARITNDTVEAWQDGMALQLDSADERSIRNWVMARIYFVFLPFRLNDPSVFKEDQGSEVWQGVSLNRVKISFAPGSSSGADDEFLFWFDPESGRLEQYAYSFAGNPGGLRFRRAFNHRRVGEILFFDQENWGINGPGLTVDQIGPDEVTSWNLISTVTMDDITVSGLEKTPGQGD